MVESGITISARTGLLVHTSISSNGVHHLNIHTESPHPFHHTASLQSQFISRSQAEALRGREVERRKVLTVIMQFWNTIKIYRGKGSEWNGRFGLTRIFCCCKLLFPHSFEGTQNWHSQFVKQIDEYRLEKEGKITRYFPWVETRLREGQAQFQALLSHSLTTMILCVTFPSPSFIFLLC